MATTVAPGANTHTSAIEEWRERRWRLVRALLTPRPRLSVSEYTERHLVLGVGSARRGPYRYDYTPYLREIADFLSDPLAGEEGVVLKSAQIGFTVGVLCAAVFYFLDQDPAPVLLMQPTLDDAERFSKKKLMPLVRASPRLRRLIAEARPGDARNTILQKTTPGATLSIVGAKSPRQMRSDSIRVFLSDERSAYDKSAGVEGNPYLLGRKRTDTYDNRKLLTGSTPVVSPDETERDYQDSDQRQYYVPCPHCKELQPLVWENLRWDKEGEGAKKRHLPDTAHFVCSANGCVIEEQHKPWMVDPANGARWIAENPDHRKPGWFVWQAYSLFPNAGWSRIARDWVDAQGDPERLQIFFNTVLARSYQEIGEKPDPEALIERREAFAAEVPAGAGVLTGAVDVQDDRLEFLVVGWGAHEESWLIAHHRIYGDPQQPEVWRALDRLRTKRYQHEGGQQLRIQCVMVDSGDGDTTDPVYNYVKPRQRQGVYAIKGDGGRGGKAKPVLLRPGKARSHGVRLWMLGTDAAKGRVLARIRIPPPERGGPPKRGYVHIPQEQPDGLDDEFLRQYAREEVRRKRGPRGESVRYYFKLGPNEALDLACYNLAALHALGDGVRLYLGQIARRLNARAAAERPDGDDAPPSGGADELPPPAAEASAAGEEATYETLAPDPPPPPKRRKSPRRARSGSWVTGYKR